jgi:hypothetical protein
MDSYISPFTMFVVSLAGAGIGAYVGAYLREKGKNLATKEDLDRIVRRTENIKAEISGDLWEKQNRWTFRRDTYVNLLDGLGDAASAVRLFLYYDEQLNKVPNEKEKAGINGAMDDCFANMQKAMAVIRRSALVVSVVCAEAAEKALERLLQAWLLAEQQHRRAYLDGCHAALSEAIDAITSAARQDLRLDPREPKGA